MSDRIVLTLPDELSARVRYIAETTAKPVEQVVLEHLKTLATTAPLPFDEQTELDALRSLSDDALWTIAREQMPSDVQARAHELMDKNSLGTINDTEYDELQNLVERADRLMLRKAESAAILRERGYPFSQEDFKPEHE